MGKITEEKWTLPTKDGHIIYGVTSCYRRNKKAVVIAHGLAGHMHEYLHQVAARFFPQKGYDVIRFNFYDSEQDARLLTECILDTHAQDLKTVSDHFKEKYDDLFVCGHNYGCPSIIKGDTDAFKAMSLWEPSFPPRSVLESEIETYANYPAISFGITVLLGEAMVNEMKEKGKNWSIQNAMRCMSPTQVIHAGNGHCIKVKDSYHEYVNADIDYQVIDHAGHYFVEGETAKQLVDTAHQWFERF